MSVAQILLEVVCDKPPKGPPGEPTVKTYSVVELQRAASSIIGRRKKLEKAVEKLKKAESKGEEVDIACAMLGIKAAKDWLAFTAKRYDMLKAALDEHGNESTKEKAKATLAWADPIAMGAVAHIIQYKDDGTESGAANAAVPPIPTVKYDFKQNKLVNADGTEFVPGATPVPDSIGDPGAATPPPPKKTVLGQKPTGVTDATPGQLKIIKAKLKSAVFAQIKIAGYVNWDAVNEKMAGLFDAGEGNIEGLASLAYDSFRSKVEDLTMDQKVGFIEAAKKIVKENATAGKIKQVKAMRTVLANAGVWLVPKDVNGLITSAQEAVAEATPYDSYSAADQQKIKTILKKIAISEAGLESGPAQHEAKWKLASAGLPISSTAIAALGLAFDAFVVPSGSGLDYLGADVQQAALEVAKAAHAQGEKIDHAVADAGIAHLSLLATEQLAQKVKGDSKPDEVGFLKEFLESVKKAKTIHLSLSPAALLNEYHPSKLLGLLSHYHLEMSDALEHKMRFSQEAEVKDRWNESAAKAVSIAKWDAIAQSMEPSQAGFLSAAKATLWTKAEEVGYTGVSSHVKVFGHSVMETVKPWYLAWLKEYEDKKKADEPEKPKAGAAPPPPPSNSSFLYSPLPAELNHQGWNKKPNKFHHLSTGQRSYVMGQIKYAIATGSISNADGTLNEKAAKALMSKVRKNLMSMWTPAGIQSVGWKMLKDKIASTHANWSPEKEHAQVVKTHELGVSYAALKDADIGAVLNHWNVGEFHQLGGYAASGKVMSPWQIQNFSNMIEKVQAAGVIEPEATPAVQPEITDSIPAGLNPLDMSPGEIAAFFSPTQPVGSPNAPPPKSKKWESPGAHGVDGAHAKKIAATGANPESAGSSHMWMMKDAGPDAFIMHGEIAANRVQSLLGLGATEHVWIVPGGWRGHDAVVQHFKAQKSFRKTGKKSPWLKGAAKQKVAHAMQQYHVVNWLIDDKDDHDGNFVTDPVTGTISGVDHGQAFKFWDSGNTMLKDMDWQPPSGVFQDPGKGFPKKMLRDFAAGKQVDLMALTDPSFLNIIERAESIPSDTYKNAFKKYAEGSVSKTGKVAPYSKKKSDKNAAGFLEGVNDRRKNLRAHVGELYASLAVTRAASLKAAGDVRPVKEIEEEVRAGLKLDDFLQGKSQPAVVNAGIVESAKVYAQAPGWDESKLPETSHVPSAAKIEDHGHVGIDMMVPSNDVKDGRIMFYQVGDVAMATFKLDRGARARLQARIPGYAASGGTPGPTKPADPVYPVFTPPAKPKFNATGADLHNTIMGVAGASSYKDAAGKSHTKIEKYLSKWAAGVSEGKPGGNYIRQAYDWAKKSSVSADPAEKAAGLYYKAALDKIGAVTGGAGWTFKDKDSVPEADRSIPPFKLDASIKKKQAAAKKNLEVEYTKSVDAAKKMWEADKKKIDTKHAGAMASYKDKKKAFDKKMEGKDVLNATKLDHYPAPTGVKKHSDSTNLGGKNLPMDMGSTWDGNYGKASVQANIETFNFDFSDAVSSLAKIGGAKKQQLTVNYVPEQTKKGGSRNYPGRGGQVRIQFPAGSSKEAIAQGLKAVGANLGIDLRPASGGEQELTYMRRMAWLRQLEGMATGHANEHYEDAEPEGTTQDKIDYWAKRFEGASKKKGSGMMHGIGYDPRYVPEKTAAGSIKKKDGKPVYKKNPKGGLAKNPLYSPIAEDMGGGRFSHKRFDVSDEECKSYGHLQHGLSNYAGAVFNSMHLKATEVRTNQGIPKTGWSPGADVKSGGSNEVYWWGSKQDSSSATIQIDPRILRYTAAWSHSGDSYGRKHGAGAKHRQGSVQERRLAETMGISRPEIYVGDRVSLLHWATKLKVSASTNKTFKKALTDKLKLSLKKLGKKGLGPDDKPISKVIT